ncbi:kinase-like protein [Pluteus cervinus]|uniref:Kinase-like protein n=1 Tax=Pluteus cervinus TaxID=181527 RepID=A0ACD3BBA4_9AGAR|nr:kinase-like protein [Pluteus cervinus]
MLAVDPTVEPTPERANTAALAALSRNASVISTSSSDSDTALNPQSRPRPIRNFSSPPGGSRQSRSPASSRPPAYLARELGIEDEQDLPRPPPPDFQANNRPKSGSKTPLTPNDVHYGKTLGEGSFSRVVLGTHRRTGQQYAVKIIDKNYLIRMKKKETALAEKNALVQLGAGHPGIVRLYLSYQDAYSLYFVLDYAPNGELQTLLTRLGSLCLPCVRHYTAQIIDAIDYVHQKHVIHRDLKPENLLLDEDFRLKLTDFGTSKVLDPSGEQRKSTFVGTPQYMCPELLESSTTGPSSDLWALGCIIFRMITGRFAFNGLSDYLTMQKIKQMDYSFPEGVDGHAKDLIQKLLVPNPSERLGAGTSGSNNDIQALRSHPFLVSIKWDTLWTDEVPAREAGLFKREVPVGKEKAWDDIGEKWDQIAGGNEDDDSDEIQWAADGKGPAYLMQRSRNGKEPSPDPRAENIGPFAKPKSIQVPQLLLSEARPTGNSPNGDGTTEGDSTSPDGSSEGAHTARNGPSASSQHTEQKSTSTLTQHSAPEEQRGRDQTMSPVQGNGPQPDVDFASILRLSVEEQILLSSPIEVRMLNQRASRLLPLSIASAISKPRQLVLTRDRLICLKHKRAGAAKVKAELTLKSTTTKEQKSVVVKVEQRGDREFIVFTATKTYTYAASNANLASSWVQHLHNVLS